MENRQDPLGNGQQIYYNFVKQYMALECQTPAQVAGVGGRRKQQVDGTS
ncbi:MAG: hypothetical protein OK455_02695 [Thaumarchaeota archaeon]|nr:hypothetical protein [Nitrososphaerota archaeon]